MLCIILLAYLYSIKLKQQLKKNAMETTFTLPVKNLHGSNLESLQNEYITAMDAVRNSIEAIAKIDFNARDYKDLNEFQSAKKERHEMISNLQNVYEYLETIAIELN